MFWFFYYALPGCLRSLLIIYFTLAVFLSSRGPIMDFLHLADMAAWKSVLSPVWTAKQLTKDFVLVIICFLLEGMFKPHVTFIFLDVWSVISILCYDWEESLPVHQQCPTQGSIGEMGPLRFDSQVSVYISISFILGKFQYAHLGKIFFLIFRLNP